MYSLKIDPLGGCSGDMFLATLVDLGAPLGKIQADIDGLHLGQGVKIETQRDTPRGFAGLRLKVKVLQNHHWMSPETADLQRRENDNFPFEQIQISKPLATSDSEHNNILKPSVQHTHRNFSDIKNIITTAQLSPRVKERAIKIFLCLAEAEGKVHGKSAEEVHFHEVGAIDSIVDIVGTCCALEYLKIDHIYSTAIGVAQGQVHCAHGQLPLPAPATQHLLMGCPVIQQPEQRELCTPTGAAIIKALASFDLPQEAMIPMAIGVGLSHRIPLMAPPFLRGTLFKNTEAIPASPWIEEKLLWISCDVDDMNPEYLPLLQERVLQAGLLDINMTPLLMKKGRPGFEIRILCKPSDRNKALEILFTHSSTFGCRVEEVQRIALARHMEVVTTPWGEVHVKKSLGETAPKFHIEFEDVARICRENNLPWTKVHEFIHQHL